MTVEEELWASPGAEPFSNPWRYGASGDGVVDSLTVLFLSAHVDEGGSRVELGHTYSWASTLTDHCIKGGPEWAPLGALPLDEGVLGQGEYEGREITLQEATASPTGARVADRVLDVLVAMHAD